MATKVRIGHASTDSAGSTANEVLISNYYDLKPDVVLRPKSAALAEKSAAACEAGCKNDKIEYSQSSRNTLYNKAEDVNFDLSKITSTCYADCSSFMTVCAIAGDSSIKYEPAPNCGTMRARFTQSGDYKALTAAKYLESSDYLRRGDILVRERYIDGSRHTVMILDNGEKVPANSGTIDLLADGTVIKIAVDMLNIGTKTAEAKLKITQIKDGIESLLTETDLYRWYSTLEKLDSSSKNTETEISKVTSKLSFTGLSPNTSYRLRVKATSASGVESFVSSSIIFTTVSDAEPATDPTIIFGSKELLKKVKKIYLNIKDKFKSVILYNK